MLTPMMPVVANGLEASFTVHKIYEQSDPKAALDAVASRIRGLATLGNKVDTAFLERFPKLEIISNFGVGYDNVDVAACAARNVIVTNTPDVLSDEVADTALALLIMTARELSAAERWLRDGKWQTQGAYRLSASLRGRTLGIFGLGRIGKAIAARAEAFGLEIHYYGRNRQEAVAYPYHDTLVGMAKACDILLIVAPGGAGTHHAVNAEVLSALGSDGLLINVGRGSTVDENALIHALDKGIIHGAGLDVFEDEPNVPARLMEFDTVSLLPHVASASVYTRDAMGQLVVDNLTNWFQTGKAVTPVPETPQRG